MTTYIDIHTITSLGANVLNRGREGAPKTTTYGGTERQVLSSQSLKKAMRDWVRDTERAPVTTRTRLYLLKIAQNITAQDESLSLNEAWKIAGDYLLSVKFVAKVPDAPVEKNEEEETDESLIEEAGEKVNLAIAALTEGAMKQIATDALSLYRAKEAGEKPPTKATLQKEFKETFLKGVGLDVALFGSMVANEKAYSVDAAAQVAYAMGTNAFRHEFDFYTAVDDLLEGNGSAMMGDVEYGTSTVYRFATVSLEALANNLGVTPEEAIGYVETFILANIKSLPTGKQNSFAARVLPSFVNISVRTTQPISLVSAFETATPTVGEAVEAFKAQRDRLESMYDETPVLSVDLEEGVTITDLTEMVRDVLNEVTRSE